MLRSILSATALLTALTAQSVVVPNANATTLGTSQLNSIIRNVNNPRSYQYGINAGELTGVPIGSYITGVSLRFMVFATNPASWPPADITWTTYDISVGPAIPTATWGADPATNFSAPPTVVRSGPMVLDAGSFGNLNVAGTPNPWSEFYFDFQTPYLYLGGDLAMLFSHPGSTDTATALYPETVVSNAAAHGVARTQSVYPAGTASLGTTFYVMRVHYGYGAGCASSTGATPVLVQNGNVVGGNGGDVRLTLANMPATGIAVFALGFSQIQVPIGGGCDLLVSLDVLLAQIASPNGRAVQTLSFPPAVVGSFFAQGAVLDPASPLGFVLSNGVSPMVN